MMGLRVRAVKLSPNFGVGDTNQFAVQISSWGLDWSTLNRFSTKEEAVAGAQGLDEFAKNHHAAFPTSILWTNSHSTNSAQPKSHDRSASKKVRAS